MTFKTLLAFALSLGFGLSALAQHGWNPGAGDAFHHGGYPGHGGDGHGGSFDVTCSSWNHQPSYCPTGYARTVNLVQQLSHGNGRCDFGRSWGFDGRGIWVNGGCRGVFRLER